MLWIQIAGDLTKSLLSNKDNGKFHLELVISVGKQYHGFGLTPLKFLHLLPHGHRMAAAALESHACLIIFKGT